MRPLREFLDEETECDRLLEVVDGCGELDRKIYLTLLDAESRQSIADIAEAVDRDRSTTYRAVRRLHEHGYVDREQETYDHGGYCYRYSPVDPDEVASALRERILECHERLDDLIEEFRETYGRQSG